MLKEDGITRSLSAVFTPEELRELRRKVQLCQASFVTIVEHSPERIQLNDGKTDHQTTGFDAGARGAVPMSTANATDTTITCEWCGNDLEKEEMESPLSSDETICDECYDKHYRFTCHWCEEDEDKEHECNLGSLFILFKPVSAHPPFLRHGQQPRWYSHREREMRPGIYRIVRYPFYWDACLDGGLYADAFEWFGPLTSGMKKNGGYADYDCGPLCRRCQRKLKHAKWHWPGERI